MKTIVSQIRVESPRRSAGVLAWWGALCLLTTVLTFPAYPQTRSAPEAGLITWPEFPAGPIRALPAAEGDAPRLATQLSTHNVYYYNPGLTVYNRSLITDYETTIARASLGWNPQGILGAGNGQLEAHVSGRLMWGGILDPIIETHHNVTGLANNRRELRRWNDSLVLFAPVVTTPFGNGLSDYPDEWPVSQAILTTPGPVTSFSIGGSYNRRVLVPWLRVFAAAGGSTLPRVRSTIDAGGAVTGVATGGLHLEWEAGSRLRLALQGDVSGLAVAGVGAWQSVLTRHVIGHGALRVDLVFGRVEIMNVLSVRPSPFTVSYRRFDGPAVGIDVAAALPAPGRGPGRLVLGFTQDFPEHYVAPDFGITAGFIAPISAR